MNRLMEIINHAGIAKGKCGIFSPQLADNAAHGQGGFRRKLRVALIQLLAATILLCFAQLSHATASCVFNSVTTSPVMPATIYVSASALTNSTVFAGNLYVNGTCTFTSVAAGDHLEVVIPFGSNPVATRVALGINGLVGGAPSVVSLSGAGCGATTPYLGTEQSQVGIVQINGTCTFSIRLQLYFQKKGNVAPSGTVGAYPMNPPGPCGTGCTGSWSDIVDCTTTTCITRVSFNALSTTFVERPATCTVNSGSLNQTINLPRLSTAQLTGVGKTSGQTPFSLSLNCSTTGGGFGVSTLWNFTEAGGQNIMSNTGTGTGFGFQINDATNTPVLNNISRQSIASAINGTNNLNYWLYYYTTGAVGAGTAVGTATFTLTYN